MQRNLRFHRDKKLLALERERTRLWRRPGMVPIDPPIQRGWVRHWVLAGWAKNHPQRAIFEDILREVNTAQRIPHRPFRHRKSGRKKKMHLTSQGFQRIKTARWKKLQWSHEYKAYFRLIYHVRQNNRFPVHYVLATHHMFELKVEQRWIHELPLLEPLVDSRLAELRVLLGKEEELRLDRLHGHRHWCHWRLNERSKQAVLHKAARKRMARIRQGDWDAEERRRRSPSLLSIPWRHHFAAGFFRAFASCRRISRSAAAARVN